MPTVGDLMRALSKLPPDLPVAIAFEQTDGDKYALPVERVVKRPAAQVLRLYGLELDGSKQVALVLAVLHD